MSDPHDRIRELKERERTELLEQILSTSRELLKKHGTDIDSLWVQLQFFIAKVDSIRR